MNVERFDDAAAFLDAATLFLLGDEPRHHLILGVSATVAARPDLAGSF